MKKRKSVHCTLYTVRIRLEVDECKKFGAKTNLFFNLLFVYNQYHGG